MINYDHGKNHTVTVNLSNLTTSPVTIQPKAIICELQQVTIAEEVFDKIEDQEKEETVTDKLNVDEAEILD